jgi:hypothetical protein
MTDVSEVTAHLRFVLKSQYHAALAMLGQSIELCPDELWESDGIHESRFGNLRITRCISRICIRMPCEAAFPSVLRITSRRCSIPDCIAGPNDPESKLPLLPPPYSKMQILEYWRQCDAAVDERVDGLDLWSPESGFSWYKLSKLEHQFINIRHIQHGAAQLADRLRSKLDVGVKWVGARKR